MRYKFLSKMLQVAEENYDLWSQLPMTLFSVWTCEQDGDKRCYGIMNFSKRTSFCYSDGKREENLTSRTANIIPLRNFVKELKRYNITEKKLKQYFLNEMEPRVFEREVQKARIREKADKRLKSLEEELKY